MGIKCFWTEPTDNVSQWLRRYSNKEKCPADPSEYSYHNAMVKIEDAEKVLNDKGYLESCDDWPREDSRWPQTCRCGYVFADSDEWQLFRKIIYIRPDTGELFLEGASNLPPGAMFDAYWSPSIWKGLDGKSLCVICPGGYQWGIDRKASNCTMPEDHAHRCWVRHGEPPLITVDKNGLTCEAGGGSIQTPNYHGFLVNGEFNP